MGLSRCVQFARARRASSQLSTTTILARDKNFFQWPGHHRASRMNFMKIVASFLLLVSTCLSSRLHLRARRSDGYNDVGGVYDSAIAQDYWASRFGAGFFAGLRALQLDGEAGVLPRKSR